MRILEVRDGFIKIDSPKKLALSSFVQIKDSSKDYIAQVVQTKRAGENIIAYARIIFLYDGSLQEYDKTLPNLNSEVVEFEYDIFKNSIQSSNPLVIGTFIENEQNIVVDKSILNKKTLVVLDSEELNRNFVSNIKEQISNTIVLDFMGNSEGQKYIAGIDFKLPLNTESLEFIFEECLNDATSDSKNLIKEIFQDLSDYSKTVPFLPFEVLKTIVDDMVDKSHIFKLLVLKNKLAKFDRLKYFATTANEASNLKKILDSKNAVIDLSKLDIAFQNRYLSVIYSELEKLENKPQLILKATNSLTKKSLKTILTSENIESLFITHSRFKYLNEIKSMFKNFVIEPSFTVNSVFKPFATLLTSMPKETYLVVGELTNRIPLISLNKKIIVDTASLEEINSQIIEEEEFEKALDFTDQETSEETIEEVTEEYLDDSIKAIDKKSEDLINRIATEVLIEEPSSEENLFSDSDDVEEEIVEPQAIIEEISYETVENLEEEVLQESVKLEEFVESDLQIESNEEQITEVVSEDTIDTENTYEEIVIGMDSLKEDDSEIREIEAIEEYHTEVDEIQTIEIPEDISDLAEEAEELISDQEANSLEETDDTLSKSDLVEAQLLEKMNFESDEIKLRDYTDSTEEIESTGVVDYSASPNGVNIARVTVAAEAEDEVLEEIVELGDETELTDDVIVVDFEDEIPEEIIDNETLDQEIVQDVDKVFTTMKEDSISDSDLDFIDELNNEETESEAILEEISLDESYEMQELEEESEFIEPLEEVKDEELVIEEKEILETRDSSTPIVPVYGADIPQEDLVISDPIEQGDTVIHAKYGNGVVEKMIKYGAKTLYSINFDNIGRRLLDPTLTEIKKV